MLATLLAILAALQLIPWEPAARLFPSLSPLLSLGGALTRHAFWPAALLGLPVLLLALWRKRWFCFHACPAGFCAEAAGRLNPKAAARFGRWPRLGTALAGLILGGALLGAPVGLCLDPLSLFNGFVSAWRMPLEHGLPPLATGFLLVLLISLLRPHLWCLRLCPLGGLQESLHAVSRRVRAPSPAHEPLPGRRLFLGAAAGGLAALLLKKSAGAAVVLRPPGAAEETAFNALCARCGACIRACPQHILVPDLGEAGAAGLMAPKVVYREGYCLEPCRACTRVCPTGAIRELSLKEKQRLALGMARVEPSRCLAWHDGLYCMMCQASCPYSAISEVERKGVPCPVVNPDRCRGCGACQNACPARPPAIVVKACPRRTLPDPPPVSPA